MTTTGDKPLDMIFDGLHRLRAVAMKSSVLARSFDITGNPLVADELEQMSVEIDACMEQIRDAYAQEIHERLEDTKKSVDRIVMTVLENAADE